MEEKTASDQLKIHKFVIPKSIVQHMDIGRHGRATVNAVSNAVKVCNTDSEHAPERSTVEKTVLEKIKIQECAIPRSIVLLMDILLNGLASDLAASPVTKELNTEQEHVWHQNMEEKTVLDQLKILKSVIPKFIVQHMDIGQHGRATVNAVSNAVKVCNTDSEHAPERSTVEKTVLEKIKIQEFAIPRSIVLLTDIILNGLASDLAASLVKREPNTEQEPV